MSDLNTPRILVLCTGNSCRSQMAEGYLRLYLKGRGEVESAGIEAHGLNPKAVTVMKEGGVDISTHRSKTVASLQDMEFDAVITVCDHANEHCPVFPGKAQRFHRNFPDPAKTSGTPEEVMQAFRDVRNLIRDFCREFVTTLMTDD